MCIGYGCICVLDLYLIVYFLMEMWYNYVIHKIQATDLSVALVKQSQTTGENMTQRYKAFSSYLLLKQANSYSYILFLSNKLPTQIFMNVISSVVGVSKQIDFITGY